MRGLPRRTFYPCHHPLRVCLPMPVSGCASLSHAPARPRARAPALCSASLVPGCGCKCAKVIPWDLCGKFCCMQARARARFPGVCYRAHRPPPGAPPSCFRVGNTGIDACARGVRRPWVLVPCAAEPSKASSGFSLDTHPRRQPRLGERAGILGRYIGQVTGLGRLVKVGFNDKTGEELVCNMVRISGRVHVDMHACRTLPATLSDKRM